MTPPPKKSTNIVVIPQVNEDWVSNKMLISALNPYGILNKQDRFYGVIFQYNIIIYPEYLVELKKKKEIADSALLGLTIAVPIGGNMVALGSFGAGTVMIGGGLLIGFIGAGTMVLGALALGAAAGLTFLFVASFFVFIFAAPLFLLLAGGALFFGAIALAGLAVFGGAGFVAVLSAIGTAVLWECGIGEALGVVALIAGGISLGGLAVAVLFGVPAA